MFKRLSLSALLLVTFMIAGVRSEEARPNILWITAEDMSPTLGCYGDAFARTPRIDQLARQSVRYTHAFATAPVCSPSRACLINGVAAPTQGTHAMRSLFPLPAEMRGFPGWLREAGYYTTNNVKTDYNSAAEPEIIEASWDANSDVAHWRGRSDEQPFFSVFNLMTTHQSRSMVWPYEQFVQEIQSQLDPQSIADPDEVPVPPYYPDTPLVRKTLARYYDCVSVMDGQVGDLLDQLEADGLADNTIVFFYSDHGSGMPRHKRALLDSGMHVPLLVRFPERYRHWAPADAGETSDRLVCFEDFGPTVLSLAGVETLPEFMRGRPFLGPLDSEPRSVVFGHRDRVDEIWDMARSVRGERFLYIRNFMPHLGYNQQSAWIDQGEIRRDFYALAQSGEATPAQQQYLASSRPVEELYDCQRDPLNLKNLADDPDYQQTLLSMRERLREHMVTSGDLGLVPETELWRRSEVTTPMGFGRSDQFRPRQLFRAAERVGSRDAAAIAEQLQDADASVRYWAAVACHSLPALSTRLRSLLHKHLEDPSPAVQVEAAAVLARSEDRRPAFETLTALLQHPDPTVILHAARTLELIGDPATYDAIQRLAARYEDAPGDLAWFIRFTTSGYLQRVAEPQ